MTQVAIPVAPAKRRIPFLREASSALAILAVGLFGYVLFPDDLAFLTRLIGIAFLVLSLDLVTGYCGVATLGHAAQFGVAAYAVGIACVRGITDPILLLLIGLAAGMAMGAISGALITRFRALPQLVLSIAVGQLVAALANKLQWLTGGSDGLSGIEPGKVLGLFGFDIYSRTAYLFSLGVLIVTFIVLQRLVNSPFGMMCRGIKDDDLRAKMIGVSVYPRLVAMFGMSGAVAGLGGALTAMSTGVVGLDSVSFERSAEVLVMLVLGGAGHLWGALLGTLIYMTFEHIVAATNPFHWMTLVGLLLILIVVFAPQGLIGALTRAARRMRKGTPT